MSLCIVATMHSLYAMSNGTEIHDTETKFYLITLYVIANSDITSNVSYKI